MYTQSMTALIPVSRDTTINRKGSEFIYPIPPTPGCIQLSAGAVYAEDVRCHSCAMHDFLWAFLLGLAVFGTAAIICVSEILSVLL